MISSNIRSFLKKHLFDAEILRLMALVLLVKPLTIVIQMLLAKYFGAGPQYDAYALAIFLVMYVGSVIGNVFTSVIVPYIIKLRRSLTTHELMGFQNAITALFGIPALIFALLLLCWPGAVVDVAGPGLPDETRAYAVRMVRLLSLPGIFILTVAMGKAILNIHNKFRLATSMTMVNALIILFTLIAFHESMGIWSIALGFAVSQVIQTVLLWLRSYSLGLVVFAKPYLPDGVTGKLWSLSWAMILTQAILLLYQLIDKMFASTLETGSISSLAYALTVKTFGIQLFQLTLITVMFTRISEMIAAGEIARCGEYIRDNIGRVMRLVLPATLVFCLASEEIVRVLFLRGEFTVADAERTTSVMAMYVLGLPALILNLIIARIFHSLQRMKERIWLGIQYLVTNVALNALMIGPLKVMGLALASSITIYLHLILSLWVLRRYRLGLGIDGWFGVLLKNHIIAVGTYLIYLATGFGRFMSAWSIHGTNAGDIVIGICKGAFVFIVYLGLFLVWRAMTARRSAGRYRH
ncbi:hypothetical protein KKG45_03020 [bacterium]|nr:hypothetical protein [bacterium]MBU1072196.1 hypothetical protein [bacterium]MBU1675858.1 hypothetical protein [bacterium]